MGRSSRLAIGAIAAAVAAGQVAPGHLGASIALATAAILLLAEARPRIGARALLPVVCGAGLIAIRLAVVPAGAPPLTAVPDGDGPWRLVVEATGSPRDGHQSATLATASRCRAGLQDRGDPAGLSGRGPRRPRHHRWARSDRDPTRRTATTCSGSVRSGTLTSRSLAIEPAPDGPGRRLELLRRGAALALTRVLPEPEAGLAAGILIGLRDLVDRDLAAAFTTAGVSHVVAISGWNIAIVAAAIGGDRRAASAGDVDRSSRSWRSSRTSRSPARRHRWCGPALMAGVVLLARETGRAGRAAAALGWAATLLLVSDPGLIGDAGFQLSSLATAGLIAWATPLTEWIGRLGRGRIPRWLAESLGVSLAAQAATLPIILVVVRSPGGAVAAGQPARGPARCAGDGGRRPRAGRRRAGRSPGRRRSSGPSWRRPAGSSCGCSSPSSTRRPASVRQRHARAAAGRGGGHPRGRRDRGRDVVATTRPCRTAGSATATPSRAGAGEGPVHSPASRRAGPRARRARDGSRGGPPSRHCSWPGRHRVRRDRPRRPGSRASRSSTSARVTRSWSKARAAAGCSSTADRTRTA